MGDIYLKKNGMKFAVVRSYHATEAEFGFSIILDKIYLTDEFIKHQSKTGNTSFPINFCLVIEKADKTIIYEPCIFISFDTDYTNIKVNAINRYETPASQSEIDNVAIMNKPVKFQYADSTLKGMSKDDLIKYIRILEHNYAVAIEFNEQQARNIEKFLKGLKQNG